jgi:CelD/BcsL family acetyltransferase involved in cellulose biosynthesis
MEPRMIAEALPTTPVVMDRFEIERRGSLDLEPADAAAYDAIIKARPSVGVFMSRAWLSGLFEEPPPFTEPGLLIFREGGVLRGFVPIGVRETHGHTRVSILGGGFGSDRADVMAERGLEVACADALLKWIDASFSRRGFVLDLRDVPADSSLWGAAHRAGYRGGPHVTLAIQDIQPLPWLDLDAYRRRPSGADSLDKHRRWLAKRGAVWSDVVDPADAIAALDTLTTLLRGRWAAHGGSTLDDPVRQRFHRRVLPRLLEQQLLRMLRLSADGRTVAVFYGMAAGSWWGYYLAGFDREWAGRIHLGRLTLATAIEHAMAEGAAEFDFLKGAEPVKYLWPVNERTTLDAEIASHHSTTQLTRVAHAARETAAALTKSARALTRGR